MNQSMCEVCGLVILRQDFESEIEFLVAIDQHWHRCRFDGYSGMII